MATVLGFIQLCLAVTFPMTLGPHWRVRVADVYQASHDAFWASHPLEQEAAQRVAGESPIHGESSNIIRRAAAAHAGLIAVGTVRTAGIAGATIVVFAVTLLIRSSRRSRRHWGLFGRRLGILAILLLPVLGLSMVWDDFNHGNFPTASLRIEREWTQYWRAFSEKDEYWARENSAIPSIASDYQTLNALRAGVVADIWRDVWGTTQMVIAFSTALLAIVVAALWRVGSKRTDPLGSPAAAPPAQPAGRP